MAVALQAGKDRPGSSSGSLAVAGAVVKLLLWAGLVEGGGRGEAGGAGPVLH